jgi:ribosomal protein S18 acetylase RimI-like enzyme
VTRLDAPSATPVLRAVTREDEPFLRELYRVTRIPEFATLALSEAQLSALCNAQFDAQAAGYRSTYPQAEHLLICSHEQPAGRLVRARDAEGLVLVDIALMPAFRRRGWGRLLLRALQDEARASAAPLRLHVEKSSPALAWYLRLGFAVSGEEGAHYALRWTPPVHC